MTHKQRATGIVALVTIVAALVASRGFEVNAQDPGGVLPTPRGQLGGPMPIGQDTAIAPPMLQATPDAEVTAEAPNPEECTVEPRLVDEILTLLGEATPEASAPDSAATPLSGEPVSEDLEEAVTDTAREYIACSNADDYLRLFALMSDRFLAQTLTEAGLSDANDIQRFDREPVPLPEAERTLLIGVSDIRQLDDGRIAAIVAGDDPTSSAPARYPTFLFVEVGDRWVVDGIIEDPASIEGTPVP